MKSQEITTIQKQPNCLDNDGHLILKPIIDIAKSYDCPFIALIGEKRIGKTYGCFAYGLKEYYKHGYPMFYARRYDKTFTENICGNLVAVHRQDIINLSKGKHNTGKLMGKYFDLVRESENASGTKVRKSREHFAFCRSLNNIETETADDKENISCVVYDEFLTRGNELKDEFNKLMILHANATGKRTDRFIPMFLLGNTVSRESAVAECFGIELRTLQRGVNVITNTKGEARIIVYYAPESKKGTDSARTYYDRFENEHINMISHGDWTLGTYRIANPKQLAEKGYTILFTHKDIAVCGKIIFEGLQPRFVVTRANNCYKLRCSSGLSKEAINYIPKTVIQMITAGFMVCETSEIGENFRDICKHLNGGAMIVNQIE